MRRQKGKYSNKIFLPASGALGRINSAGTSFNARRQQYQVTKSMTLVYAPTTTAHNPQLNFSTIRSDTWSKIL